MVNLQFLFNLTAIAIGFVSATCFCNDALRNKAKDIALSSATIVGWNPTQLKALSAQKAQYIVGAIFLTFSFGLQAAAVLIPKELQIVLPPLFQTPLVQLSTILLVASAIAFLAISCISKGTELKAQKYLKDLIAAQGSRGKP